MDILGHFNANFVIYGQHRRKICYLQLKAQYLFRLANHSNWAARIKDLRQFLYRSNALMLNQHPLPTIEEYKVE